MKFDPGWSSHYPILVKVLNQIQTGDVLELGMGPFSTPLLHWLCVDKGLKLFSFDNDPKYWELNQKFATATSFHQMSLILNDNWDDLWQGPFSLADKHFSVAFVDHKPAKRRYLDIAKLAKLADLVIIHDSEPEQDKYYAYRRIWPLFKYRFDYTKAKPHTTVLSNINDLSFLHK